MGEVVEALHELRRLAHDGERCPRCGGRTYVAGGWWLTCSRTMCGEVLRFVGEVYGVAR